MIAALRRRWLSAVAGGVLAVLIADGAGMIWFAEDIQRTPSPPGPRTDAIVVLTGGPLRLKEGLALLAADRAQKLFVSGVNRGVELNDLLRVAGQPPSSAACCIVLGHDADNTMGNAREAQRWMAQEGFASLRLVTANYHMRRSLLEFRRAMPAVTIVPHPVFPDSIRRDWWQWRGTLSLIAVEYHKYLAALARPWIPGLA
jgi:uncharacterized SAM-binding protein YcdF (DUF218 family)